jgi:hypothetical protein
MLYTTELSRKWAFIWYFFWVLWSILVLQTLRQFASMMDVYLGGALMFICGGLFEYIDA